MAPVAAKVAVVSVGAAVATGGAVVAPSLLEHHPSATHHARVRHTADVPVQASVGRATPLLVSRTAVVAATHRFSATGGTSTREAGDGGGSHDAVSTAREARTEGDSTETRSNETAVAAQPGRDASHSDVRGSESSSSGDSSGRDSSGGDSSGDSSGGGSGGGDGGVVPIGSNPVVTATVPLGDDQPALADPSSGHG